MIVKPEPVYLVELTILDCVNTSVLKLISHPCAIRERSLLSKSNFPASCDNMVDQFERLKTAYIVPESSHLRLVEEIELIVCKVSPPSKYILGLKFIL